jgi:hypothetical protein
MMHELGYWEDCARSAELSLEGNRLLAQEIVGSIRRLFAGVVGWMDQLVPVFGQRGRLPPV